MADHACGIRDVPMLLPEAIADFVFDRHVEQYIDDAACAKPIVDVGQPHFTDALTAILSVDEELRNVSLAGPFGHVGVFNDVESKPVANGAAVVEDQER